MIKATLVTVTGMGLGLLLVVFTAAASPNYFEIGLEHHAAGNFPAAEIELRNALQESPNNVPARVLLGVVLLELDNPREAAVELEKGLTLGGDRNLILIPLGQIYLQLLEPEKVLTNVIPTGTDPAVDGEVLLLHGDAALLLGDLGNAARSYADAHELLPRDPRPLIGEARIALARGRDTVADELIAEALANDPESASVWTLKGLVHRDRGEHEVARAAFDKALKLDPKSIKALGARAALLLDLGDRTSAAADVAALRAENPNDLEGLYLQSWLLVSNGEHERAQELLQATAETLRELRDEHRKKLPQMELLFGIVNFLSSKYEQAVENFTTFLKRFPDHSGATRYLAATYLAAGDWDKVIQTLNPAAGEDLPSDPATLSLLAEAFRSSGNSNRAIRIYERALEIEPEHRDFKLALATARFAVGDRAVAIAALEKLILEAPEDRESQMQLVGMYVAAGRVADSLNLAERLAKDDPRDATMQNLLGAVMMKFGRYADAKKYFVLAEELDPSAVLARLNQARLARRLDQLPAAIGHYREALERSPDSGEALLELSEALIAQGNMEAAAPLLQTLLERDPANVKGRIAQLWVRLSRSGSNGMDTVIFEFTQDFPNNTVGQLGIARIYRAMGELDNARLLLRRAGQNAEFNADYLYEVAHEQLSLGDANNAQWAVTKALNGNPRHLGAMTYRVVVMLALDRLDDAKAALVELKSVYPQSSETHRAEGDLMRAIGEFDAAVEQYANAYRIAPTRASVQRLFETQVESGDIPAALKTIRVWILLHPDDLDSRHSLAEKLISVGQYRPAQLVYEGILKRTAADPLLLNNLAFVLQKLGDKRALDYATQAVEIAPEHPRFLDTYGWILAENGEPERGLEILRDAYTRESTNQEIRYHIALALLGLERTDAARRELSSALASEREFSSKADAKALFEKLGGDVL